MAARISFNKAPLIGGELELLKEALKSGKISGDGDFCRKCQAYFENLLLCKKALMTPSCTAALELAAMLIEIKPGDEVIMPSFTFVSTANAFALRGAKIVFVDIRPDTMNLDESLIEQAISDKTRAIVPVHYAGVSCEMSVIDSIATKYGLHVIEDAAQAVMSEYEGQAVGRRGHLAAYSFHETKNYTSGGEGGLLAINDDRFVGAAEILREKGTNRANFFRGKTDKYTWMKVGSSYLPGELQAAHLYGQLLKAEQINNRRLDLWDNYFEELKPLQASKRLGLPFVPSNCRHNGHIFYLKCADLEERSRLIRHLSDQQISATFHYVPLHTAPAASSVSRFHGEDIYTTIESERLVRLPLYFNLSDLEQQKIIDAVNQFYR